MWYLGVRRFQTQPYDSEKWLYFNYDLHMAKVYHRLSDSLRGQTQTFFSRSL